MFRAKIPLSERLHNMFVPLSFLEEKAGNDDNQTIILVRPEAFRILFYCGFFIMLGTGVIVSFLGADQKWNKFKVDDNPIKRRFGANNICIFFDDPPFTYFSASFWVVLLILVLCYQVTDFLRVHDAYMMIKLLQKDFIHIIKQQQLLKQLCLYFLHKV